MGPAGDRRGVGWVRRGDRGGTCTNRGCIPSKALIRAAQAWSAAGRHPFAGVGTARVGLDWTEVQAQKDRLVGDLRRERYHDVLAKRSDIAHIEGRGVFQPDGSVRVGERTYRAGRYVIATGGAPRIVDFPRVAEAEPLTSTTLMQLPKPPGSLIVLGGRAVALELGQLMARFGAEVTILQRSGPLVPEHEPEVGHAIAGSLSEDGIRVITGGPGDPAGPRGRPPRGDRADHGADPGV